MRHERKSQPNLRDSEAQSQGNLQYLQFEIIEGVRFKLNLAADDALSNFQLSVLLAVFTLASFAQIGTCSRSLLKPIFSY